MKRPQLPLIPSVLLLTGLAGVSGLAGCARVEVAPIEVKPIHITMDINLRIDRSLDDFFAYQKPAGGDAVAVPAPTTIPAAN